MAIKDDPVLVMTTMLDLFTKLGAKTPKDVIIAIFGVALGMAHADQITPEELTEIFMECRDEFTEAEKDALVNKAKAKLVKLGFLVPQVVH